MVYTCHLGTSEVAIGGLQVQVHPPTQGGQLRAQAILPQNNKTKHRKKFTELCLPCSQLLLCPHQELSTEASAPVVAFAPLRALLPIP